MSHTNRRNGSIDCLLWWPWNHIEGKLSHYRGHCIDLRTSIKIYSFIHTQVTATLDEKAENDIVIGVNKLGIGVAMNNTVPATPNTVPPHTTHANVNNIQLDDVQKLQQQLQDIKEQVIKWTFVFFFR